MEGAGLCAEFRGKGSGRKVEGARVDQESVADVLVGGAEVVDDGAVDVMRNLVYDVHDVALQDLREIWRHPPCECAHTQRTCCDKRAAMPSVHVMCACVCACVRRGTTTGCSTSPRSGDTLVKDVRGQTGRWQHSDSDQRETCVCVCV